MAKVNALCTVSRSLFAVFAMAARLVEFIASMGTLSATVKEDQLYTGLVTHWELAVMCEIRRRGNRYTGVRGDGHIDHKFKFCEFH